MKKRRSKFIDPERLETLQKMSRDESLTELANQQARIASAEDALKEDSDIQNLKADLKALTDPHREEIKAAKAEISVLLAQL